MTAVALESGRVDVGEAQAVTGEGKTLTVFTPTFDRAHLLPRLYESLCAQTDKDFEWLVVDDGSRDGTETLVRGWAVEGRIPIRYVFQENQGMHGAHNTAYRMIRTTLNTCMDSDDILPPKSVETILRTWRSMDQQGLGGIVGLDATFDGTVIGTIFTKDETTIGEFYAAGGRGDKKLVYRTDVIRRYPEYPLFPGEKYVGLGWKYLLVDRDFRLRATNEVLVLVEYQPDGSSKTMWRQYRENPRGFVFYRREVLLHLPRSRRRVLDAAHYVASCILARDRRWLADSPAKMLTLLVAPLGVVLWVVILLKTRHRAWPN